MTEQDEDDLYYAELLTYVRRVTGLPLRQAAFVAEDVSTEDRDFPKPQMIVDAAIARGYDVDKKHAAQAANRLGPDIIEDPAEVVANLYLACPRAFMTEVPTIGRAPVSQDPELTEQLNELLDGLPDGIKGAIAKINVIDGEATVWVHDSANMIDRPIGPIDITRYESENQLLSALSNLGWRIGRVLAADCN
jgi:hypothetical protein